MAETASCTLAVTWQGGGSAPGAKRSQEAVGLAHPRWMWKQAGAQGSVGNSLQLDLSKGLAGEESPATPGARARAEGGWRKAAT